MGLVIKHTDLNLSKLEFTIEHGVSDLTGKPIDYIRAPLTILDGVGSKAASEIVAKQPFKDLKDFLRKVDLSKVDVKVFETLVKKSCLPPSWGSSNSQRVMENYHAIRNQLDKEKVQTKKEEAYLSKFDGGLFENFGNSKISL
jgi:DNA polymerase III alpha subunit